MQRNADNAALDADANGVPLFSYARREQSLHRATLDKLQEQQWKAVEAGGGLEKPPAVSLPTGADEATRLAEETRG